MSFTKITTESILTKPSMLFTESELLHQYNEYFGREKDSLEPIILNKASRECFYSLAEYTKGQAGSFKFYLITLMDDNTQICMLNLIDECKDGTNCKYCSPILKNKGKFGYLRNNVASYDDETDNQCYWRSSNNEVEEYVYDTVVDYDNTIITNKKCKYGDNCWYYKNGTCWFIH
jgi:hypothetical protein